MMLIVLYFCFSISVGHQSGEPDITGHEEQWVMEEDMKCFVSSFQSFPYEHNFHFGSLYSLFSTGVKLEPWEKTGAFFCI